MITRQVNKALTQNTAINRNRQRDKISLSTDTTQYKKQNKTEINLNRIDSNVIYDSSHKETYSRHTYLSFVVVVAVPLEFWFEDVLLKCFISG